MLVVQTHAWTVVSAALTRLVFKFVNASLDSLEQTVLSQQHAWTTHVKTVPHASINHQLPAVPIIANAQLTSTVRTVITKLLLNYVTQVIRMQHLVKHGVTLVSAHSHTLITWFQFQSIVQPLVDYVEMWRLVLTLRLTVSSGPICNFVIK